MRKKLHIKMSASEMLCLVRYFGLIIGDLIPEDDQSWHLYKYLRQILDIVASPQIVRSDAKVLKILIQKHNELYVNLFGNLKPKFHNLLHYPRILLQNGPCINFWSMRFESRHRELKANVQSMSSCKNLLVTIATKQILKVCEVIHNIECENSFISFVFLITATVKFFFFFFFSYFSNVKETKYYNQLQMHGNLYKTGTFFVTNVESSEKEFGAILKIINVKDLFFHVKIFEEITFDEHYHAYIVHPKGNDNKFIKYSDLPAITPCLSVKNHNTHFVSTRYGL